MFTPRQHLAVLLILSNWHQPGQLCRSREDESLRWRLRTSAPGRWTSLVWKGTPHTDGSPVSLSPAKGREHMFSARRQVTENDRPTCCGRSCNSLGSLIK